MITEKNWEFLLQKQAELDEIILRASQTNLKWVSRFNAERLKLALLVEVGEFANEIKSFKLWRKKPEIDWVKAKEELIDCLGYFLGLCNIYQIDVSFDFSKEKQKELEFNELLLKFFYNTNDLFITKDEYWYNLGATKLTEKIKLDTYYTWLKTFNELCLKLQIDEKKLLGVYLEKNKVNQQRAKEK
jgi:dimeric dUTPase (all-alpha-NTP-PPase superfamily)